MATKKQGYNPRSIPADKVQVNFNIPAALSEKVRVICYKNRVNKTELFTDALTAYVEKWEKANGKIKV